MMVMRVRSDNCLPVDEVGIRALEWGEGRGRCQLMYCIVLY